jgi:zinc protease
LYDILRGGLSLARALLLLLAVAAVCYPAPFRTGTLENGLTVIAVADSSAPVVTICIAVRTGATCQTPETCGLAHFYEHMFFKGNSRLPDQTAFTRRLRELGIINNGMTSDEMVRYYITLPSERLAEGLEFMYDAIATPSFDEEEIERERQVVLDEYYRNTTSPYWDYWQTRERVLFPDAPWRASAIGLPEVISSADRATMRRFQDTYYVPDNCALLVAGDVDPASVLSLSASTFSGWEGGGTSDYADLPVLIRIDRDTTVTMDSPAGTTDISIVYAGPPLHLDPSSTYAADVWGCYLGEMSGRFYTDLVTNGPFTSIQGSYYTQRYSPIISFGGSFPAGSADEVLAALESEIDQLCDISYYDPEGLRRAAASLRRHRLFSEETAYDVAVESMAFWWIEWGGLDYYQTYLDSLAAVTLEDVDRFLGDYLRDRPRVIFVMQPSGGLE